MKIFNKINPIIDLIIFLVLFSTCSFEKKPQLVIPDKRRFEIFTHFINPIIEKYGISKLPETSMLKDDLEFRIWVEFTGQHDAFIMKRRSGNWSAFSIKEIDCNKINYYKGGFYQIGKIELSSPKSGWENAWKKLVDADMIDLMYSNYILTFDEGNYSIETSIAEIYKVRFYGNQDKSDEAQKMKRIGEIIANEFGLGNFKAGNVCMEK